MSFLCEALDRRVDMDLFKRNELTYILDVFDEHTQAVRQTDALATGIFGSGYFWFR